MITPPTMRIGAETRIVRPMKTTSWTCWTSFVLRVMSEAGPKRLTSTCENVSTLREDRAAQVAPEAHRDPRAPVDADDRRDAEQGGDAEHQRAGSQDVVVVAAWRRRC